MASTDSAAGNISAWAPLRRRAFRWLWLGVLISLTGTWMQTVGAQWLLVDQPNAAALVALVQVANTVPVMLLALPGGVLADSFDRRWRLFTVQVYFFVVGLLLVGLTVAGQMPLGLLLAFSFALGVGAAVQLPAWQAVIPDLVPRNEIGAATRWEMVGINLARSVGPALAGLVIAAFGVSTVFAVNAASVVFLAVALLLWRRPQVDSELGRERFVPALRAGGRYIRHEPLVRRILLRAVLFITPAMALWALLPLVARQQLGLRAGGYGVLFGALGVGAIVGALALGSVRSRLSTNAMLTAAGALYVAGLVGIVEAPNFAVALLILVFAGLAWVAAVSTLIAELAIFLRACAGAFPRPATSTAGQPCIGAMYNSPSTPSRTAAPSWSPSSTPSPPSIRRTSWPPPARYASPGYEPGPPDGSSTRTESGHAASSKSSASRPGKNTNANTPGASPPRTKTSNKQRRRSPTRPHAPTICSHRRGAPERLSNRRRIELSTAVGDSAPGHDRGDMTRAGSPHRSMAGG